ncbi:uncharacterized protein Nmag_0053 [Natrialba magadii ATCC 43099]|uniref:DUF7115 domain-containing protein n=1 Tax=Natrialba magadii (strain ATCC 43099 / DSM 3394 / CCM 3739 / CIP 104546 / IAM 13178 / JCM 8861 / NBRC 102185 / NCIMB 2190 / MS3) TaxID=547559 RepID=D3SVT3_NATMM|nr:hypothetical protein [Natrialba magadii]ADD03652.1 uncharacterized protein Nmag_0053 [Natrialba magadii ATCC 43099]ELY34418.1 hypothetical protein C500_00747 [Natrialba magadii ATCC 43099]
MNVPGIVQSTLDGEEIAARVSLGGEDELFVTSSRTLVYRSEGLLSDESVDDYPHDADRLTLSEGRRKTKFTLEYPLEDDRQFTVPSKATDDVLHPVIAGVLNGNGITDAGETVVQTYRFSELTLIITSDRLVKHIGAAVWDEDYEEYAFEDVTNLAFEDGSVATQIVLAVDGRPQRIKAPNDEANDLRERLQRALFDYHDVESLAELNDVVGVDEDDEPDESTSSMDFGDSVDPLDANPPELSDREDSGRAREQTQPQTQSQSQPQDQSMSDTEAQASQAAASDPLAQQETQTQAQAQTQTQTQANTSSETSSVAEWGQQNQESSTGVGSADSAQSTPTGSDVATDSPDEDRTGEAGIVDTDPIFEEPADSSTTDGDAALDTDPTHEPAPAPAPAVLDRLDALETAVEEQNELIERQQETIEQLITELRQGR